MHFKKAYFVIIALKLFNYSAKEKNKLLLLSTNFGVKVVGLCYKKYHKK
jgi:hypothetical protein